MEKIPTKGEKHEARHECSNLEKHTKKLKWGPLRNDKNAHKLVQQHPFVKEQRKRKKN